MKKTIVISIICILLVILAILSIVIFSIQNGKLQMPFEESEISYIKDNKDYARLDKEAIYKIEISSNNSYKTVQDSNEIKNIIDSLNSYEGYKISKDKVLLGNQLKLVLYTEKNTLEIYISSGTISINSAHYKTNEDYKESLERLCSLENFY